MWDEEPRHTDEKISPTKLAIDDDLPSIESGVDELRKGKQFLYFMTVTKTNTVTSYSATSTVASVACTPYEFTMDMCPG